MRRIYAGLLLLTFGYAFTVTGPVQLNNVPKVTIVKPELKTSVGSQSLVPYKIEVRDVEDGFSGYDEITPTQVFLKVAWIKDAAKLPSYEAKEKKDENLYRIISNNGCINCHSFRQKLAGPSFEQVSKKYAKIPESVTSLAAKIKNGSKGVWGDSQQMPAHPSISDEEARALVTWIFQHSAENHFQYIAGIEGAVQLNPEAKPREGFYVFTATYTDHGVNGKDFRTGTQTVLVPAN